MERFCPLHLRTKFVATAVAQQRGPVLVSLTASDEHEPLIEVDVLDAELTTLRHAKPASVNQRGHEPGRAAQRAQQRCRFGDAENDRQVLALFGSRGQGHAFRFETEHFAAEKQQGAEGLILRAGRHALPCGQVRELIANPLRIDPRTLDAFPLRDIREKAPRPITVAALRAVRIVPRPDARPQLLERRQ